MLANATEWENFYRAVKTKAQLDLNQYKPNQLQRRVLSMAEQKECRTLGDFQRWVTADSINMAWFLDKLAINVSELFRNMEKWKELREKVVPELLQTSKKLKCWSAGCSYGAEAHSLAMLLHKDFPGAHTILGTDIDLAALDQARKGVFSSADVKGVPPEYRDRYLLQADDKWYAKPEIKAYLKFERQNLLADRFDTNFDLILCRNVVIYFTDEAKDELYERFFAALRPGGILFAGSTERVFKAGTIGYETPYPFFYRKPLKGKQTWQSAS